MNGAKHTPGPWMHLGGTGIVSSRHQLPVATVLGRSTSEIAANANLMAAAPDMKASLAIALRALEEIPDPSILQRQAIREARVSLALLRS